MPVAAVGNEGKYSWFPCRTDQLSGDHIIEIGKALNKYNKKQNQSA
ncbi:hypothetical protein D051_1077 [Vibrio parahaemolyticus VPCR-2010]|nr:hypothetical protein D051_1077 [Vibrio parahaemolyticus VPCR-2010]